MQKHGFKKPCSDRDLSFSVGGHTLRTAERSFGRLVLENVPAGRAELEDPFLM